MPKLKSKAARTDKDGAEEQAMVARRRGAKEQELVVSLGFLSLLFSLAFQVLSLPLFSVSARM